MIPEEIRVMLITLEQVGFWWMVWVLGITSLTSVVQHSTQHDQSTASSLTNQNHSIVKHSMVQPWNPGCTR